MLSLVYPSPFFFMPEEGWMAFPGVWSPDRNTFASHLDWEKVDGSLITKIFLEFTYQSSP